MRLAIATLAGALLLGPLAARAGDYPGLLQPLHDVTLSSGVGGVVASRRVRPGSQVRAGQVLMVLDDRLQSVEAERRRVILDDTSELKATEERLRINRGLYEDAKKVFEKTGSISRDELARLEAEYLATQGRLEQLQAQKKRERLEQQGAVQEQQMRQLVAPVAGVVTKVDIEPGEFAKAGEPLVRLVDASTLVFKANLPIVEAQVVQETRTSIRVLVVPLPAFGPDDIATIERGELSRRRIADFKGYRGKIHEGKTISLAGLRRARRSSCVACHRLRDGARGPVRRAVRSRRR